MRKLALVGLIVLTAGCGPAPGGPQGGPSGNGAVAGSATGKPAAIPAQPAVQADAYADVPEALEALCQAAESGDSDERRQAEQWLVLQQAEAVPALSALLQDNDADLRARVAVCRLMSKLGKAAKPVLLESLSSDVPLIRLNAVTGLGAIRPSDREILDRLLELLDGEDEKMQRAAIQALARIGPPAKEAAPKLQAIMNSETNDTLRGEARRALKVIDPRRGLLLED